MSVNSKTKYWMDIAHYDLVSAEAMLESIHSDINNAHSMHLCYP